MGKPPADLFVKLVELVCSRGDEGCIDTPTHSFYSYIVFKWDRTLLHVVITFDIGNSSRHINNGRLGKEVIGKQVKAPDHFALQGHVRKVGCETRCHDEMEVRTRLEVRIWEGVRKRMGEAGYGRSVQFICAKTSGQTVVK